MKLVAVLALVWLSACSQNSDEDSSEGPVHDKAKILIAISPPSKAWFREEPPPQSPRDFPIDEGSYALFRAKLYIDPKVIQDIELPSDYPYTTVPVHCGGHMKAGFINESTCFVGSPTPLTWSEIDGEIVIGQGQETVTGRVFCVANVAKKPLSDATCRRYDYL